jgi:hypothetical protein
MDIYIFLWLYNSQSSFSAAEYNPWFGGGGIDIEEGREKKRGG